MPSRRQRDAALHVVRQMPMPTLFYVTAPSRNDTMRAAMLS